MNRVIDRTFSQLQPDTSRPLTFTSRSGTIPLRMGDPGDMVVNVKVVLASGRVEFLDDNERTVRLDQANQVITFPVEVKAAGPSNIDVSWSRRRGAVFVEHWWESPRQPDRAVITIGRPYWIALLGGFRGARGSSEEIPLRDSATRDAVTRRDSVVTTLPADGLPSAHRVNARSVTVSSLCSIYTSPPHAEHRLLADPSGILTSVRVPSSSIVWRDGLADARVVANRVMTSSRFLVVLPLLCPVAEQIIRLYLVSSDLPDRRLKCSWSSSSSGSCPRSSTVRAVPSDPPGPAASRADVRADPENLIVSGT